MTPSHEVGLKSPGNAEASQLATAQDSRVYHTPSPETAEEESIEEDDVMQVDFF